jgi:hypothetical protein
MIILVSYDLKKPGKDYSSLYKTLKSANNWWHYLESTWILYVNSDNASQSIETWSQAIKSAVDANDFYIVIDITKQYRQGSLPKEAWDWMVEHENK